MPWTTTTTTVALPLTSGSHCWSISGCQDDDRDGAFITSLLVVIFRPHKSIFKVCWRCSTEIYLRLNFFRSFYGFSRVLTSHWPWLRRLHHHLSRLHDRSGIHSVIHWLARDNELLLAIDHATWIQSAEGETCIRLHGPQQRPCHLNPRCASTTTSSVFTATSSSASSAEAPRSWCLFPRTSLRTPDGGCWTHEPAICLDCRTPGDLTIREFLVPAHQNHRLKHRTAGKKLHTYKYFSLSHMRPHENILIFTKYFSLSHLRPHENILIFTKYLIGNQKQKMVIHLTKYVLNPKSHSALFKSGVWYFTYGVWLQKLFKDNQACQISFEWLLTYYNSTFQKYYENVIFLLQISWHDFLQKPMLKESILDHWPTTLTKFWDLLFTVFNTAKV